MEKVHGSVWPHSSFKNEVGSLDVAANFCSRVASYYPRFCGDHFRSMHNFPKHRDSLLGQPDRRGSRQIATELRMNALVRSK